MNTKIKKQFTGNLNITSFRINLGININILDNIINNRNEYNEIEETNFFYSKNDNIINDEIWKNSNFKEEYFSFLERNIEDPNKTEKNPSIIY